MKTFTNRLKAVLLGGVVLFCLAGCEKMKTDISDLKGRVAELEKQSDEMNTNIQALQTILAAQQNDEKIVSVKEISNGYEIAFSTGKTITIFNGKDGDDGKTPVIAIAQDDDGKFYWTLDGEWMLTDGQKVPAVGQDGKAGATPVISIKKDVDDEYYWTVDGQWILVDGAKVKAAGEDGAQGPKGEKGDSLFKSVTQDDDNVYFTLSDGTVLTVPKAVKAIPESFVDLGLPSGSLWATCNLGASVPEEFGNYYAWGETSTKAKYTEFDCVTFGKWVDELKSNSIVDANGNLTANYDVAQKLGKGRMPTKAELEELRTKCAWTWTSQNGVNGYKVTGPNGNSIFLPAAGYRYLSTLCNVSSYGNYWSSTTYNDSGGAYYLLFDTNDFDLDDVDRFSGLPIRPVMDK